MAIGGHLSHAGKSALHSLDRYSLLIPCPGFSDEEKKGGKSDFEKDLNQKFPEIPAPFPAYGPKSADFGHNLQNSGLQAKKFAAKFAAAGNCTNGCQEQKSTFGSSGEAAQQILGWMFATAAAGA